MSDQSKNESVMELIIGAVKDAALKVAWGCFVILFVVIALAVLVLVLFGPLYALNWLVPEWGMWQLIPWGAWFVFCVLLCENLNNASERRNRNTATITQVQ